MNESEKKFIKSGGFGISVDIYIRSGGRILLENELLNFQ